jgi:hypothetical protein
VKGVYQLGVACQTVLHAAAPTISLNE